MAQKWLLEHENPSRNIVCFSYLWIIFYIRLRISKIC
jgi:hypothetical protein